MITFVPAWDLNTQKRSGVDLLGVIHSFIDSEIEYQILILDYIPELRYFLHRYGLLESRYINLFDYLQGFNGVNQRCLTLDMLCFPKEVHYVYTPFHILVYEGRTCLGKVHLGIGSQVTEVHYFEKNELLRIEIYDDRGFLSSCKFFEKGELSYTEYLDNEGQWIIRHLASLEVQVNPQNRKGLKKDEYGDMNELVFELCESNLQDSFEGVIFSLTDKRLSYINLDKFSDRLVFSIFNGRFTKFKYLEYLLSCSRAVILDSALQVKEASSHLPKDGKEKLFLANPYDTRFNLSRTHEMKVEVLYIHSLGFVEKKIEKNLKDIVEFLFNSISQAPLEREFKIVIQVFDKKQKVFYLKVLEKLYLEYFSEEVINLEQEMGKYDSVLDSTFRVPLLIFKKVKESFKIKLNTTENDLFKILHESRLIIDLNLGPDLFVQMAGISSGIPQINQSQTEYIIEGKNGIILQEGDSLKKAISYYLDHLKHWQTARMYTVQQIQKYSGVALRQRLLMLLDNKLD